MSAQLQTIVALGLVALTAMLLLRDFRKKRAQPGCGSTCGAVSPEIKKLQSRLRKG
jgi:hypothetical protein